MREPTEEEINAAAGITQPFRQYIRDTPGLLSLLYDIDLLPEQIRLPINAIRMVAICELFKRVPPDQMATLFESDGTR